MASKRFQWKIAAACALAPLAAALAHCDLNPQPFPPSGAEGFPASGGMSSGGGSAIPAEPGVEGGELSLGGGPADASQRPQTPPSSSEAGSSGDAGSVADAPPEASDAAGTGTESGEDAAADAPAADAPGDASEQ